MPEFHIGRYTYLTSSNLYYNLYLSKQLDTDDIVKSYDQVLHQSLDKIFREQIRDFLLGLRRNDNLKSMIMPILEQEPVVSRYFSKEELGKLPLLWIVVLAGYTDSAELLVRSGADVNELFGRRNPQVIDEKWTVLHVLMQMDPSPENERLIRLIADRGVDLQVRDFWGRTVLHYAVDAGRVQMTEMLLDKGADINAADDQGDTPLLAAAWRPKNPISNELLSLLLKHGANVFATNRGGENVLHYLAFLEPQEHAVELVRVFIDKGVSLDAKGIILNQPIHIAALNGKNELVKLYLDHGANVNALTRNGESPLYFATRRVYNSTVVDTLLKRGANVNLRTIDTLGSRTELHAACETASSHTSNEYENTIRLLLSAGADVLIEDINGKTPLALISSGEQVEPPETRLLIKALALIKARQPLIELKDERIIERYQKLQDCYRDCIEEINRMKSTRFIETCTLFELLTKSHCQIAALMRNPNFETKFQQCDLSGFSTYAEDIRRAFERAQKHYRAMLEQEKVIDEALYDMLPYVVVRRMVHYILCNDC